MADDVNTVLEQLAEDQPDWLRDAIINGVESNPMIIIDPRLQNFINQIRENPDVFNKATVNGVISRMSGTLVSPNEQYEEQVAGQTFEQRQAAFEQAARDAMAVNREERLADRPPETVYADTLNVSDSADKAMFADYSGVESAYKGLTTAEELRKLWYDPMAPEFQDIRQMTQRLQTSLAEIEGFLAREDGQAYLAANPDLPIGVSFSIESGDESLFEGLTFGKEEFSWSEAINLLSSPALTPNHIRKLNETLFAAGFYNNENQPSNLGDYRDGMLQATWRNIVTQSFLRNQSPTEYVQGLLQGRIDQIEKYRSTFDESTLAARMDDIAFTLIGRRLRPEEFEKFKNEISLFGQDPEEMLRAGEVPQQSQFEMLEGGITEAIQTKLQNAISQAYAPQFERRYAYSTRQRQSDDFMALLSNRRDPTELPTMPSIVAEQGVEQ
jgi:hypothetical protein